MPDLDDIVWEDFDEDPGWDIQETPPDGWQAREVLREVKRRVFRLVSGTLTGTEATTLRSIWNTARGGAGTTSVTPPGEGSAVTVEFAEPDDRLRLERIKGDQWSAAVVVREVL